MVHAWKLNEAKLKHWNFFFSFVKWIARDKYTDRVKLEFSRSLITCNYANGWNLLREFVFFLLHSSSPYPFEIDSSAVKTSISSCRFSNFLVYFITVLPTKSTTFYLRSGRSVNFIFSLPHSSFSLPNLQNRINLFNWII